MEVQSLEFVVLHADGSLQKLTVDADSARVGSGAHCEIRLPPEEAAVEQLAVEVRSGGVFAEARSLDPPTLLNGMPFAQGRLLPESVLRVGRLELSVRATTSEANASTLAKGKQERPSPLIYLLAAIGFPWGFYVLFTHHAVASSLPAAVPPPALFAAQAAICAEQDVEPARLRGQSELLQADAERERAPFRPEEGVAAVEGYARAAACLGLAGDDTGAVNATNAAERLKAKLNDEFHVHQVRLEHALATKAYERVRVEARALLAFVGRRGGEYASFLSNLDRQVELKFSGKKR